MNYTIYLNTINNISLKFKLSEDVRDLITSYLDNDSCPVHYPQKIITSDKSIKMNYCAKEDNFFPLDKICPCNFNLNIKYDYENKMITVIREHQSMIICMIESNDEREVGFEIVDMEVCSCDCHCYCDDCEEYFYVENINTHDYCEYCDEYICLDNEHNMHGYCDSCDKLICEANILHKYCYKCKELICLITDEKHVDCENCERMHCNKN